MGLLGSFGIAHPIYNNRFNILKKYVGTLSSVSSNQITLTAMPPNSSDTLDRLLGQTVADSIGSDFAGKLNKIILGPSTHSSNEGYTEVLNIDYGVSSGTHIIHTEVAPSYLYSSGDPVTIITYGIPDGWIPDSSGDFSFGRIVYNNGASGDSYSDMYSFNLFNNLASANNSAHIDIGKLMASTRYKLSIIYKALSYTSGASGFSIKLPDDSYVGTIVISSSATSWTAASAMFTTLSNMSGGDSYLYLSNSGLSTSSDFYVAGISISNARNDLTYYYSTGLSSISDYPDLGSIKVSRCNSPKTISLSNGDKFLYRLNSLQYLPIYRYKLTYNFSNLSTENLNTLKSIIDWQNKGYFINHFPGLNGLPYCLTGKISLSSSISKYITDFDLNNVGLTFEEVEI